MPAYVIAQFDVNDVDMYYEYASKIFETTKGYGGRILAANDAEVREGSIPHLRTVVGEFPLLEKAHAWVRIRGLSGDHWLTAQLDDGGPVHGGGACDAAAGD